MQERMRVVHLPNDVVALVVRGRVWLLRDDEEQYREGELAALIERYCAEPPEASRDAAIGSRRPRSPARRPVQ
jgi:hypothetical protein